MGLIKRIVKVLMPLFDYFIGVCVGIIFAGGWELKLAGIYGVRWYWMKMLVLVYLRINLSVLKLLVSFIL